jgi:prevent-host-death family protein
MDVSVRELRNHTARVISAVEGGEVVVLTSHGRPIADIVPHRTRSERRPSDLFLADLAAIRKLSLELDVDSDPSDYELDDTTDDLRV